jgi:hypothetical protein
MIHTHNCTATTATTTAAAAADVAASAAAAIDAATFAAVYLSVNMWPSPPRFLNLGLENKILRTCVYQNKKGEKKRKFVASAQRRCI